MIYVNILLLINICKLQYMTDKGLVYKILRDILHDKSTNSPMEKKKS